MQKIEREFGFYVPGLWIISWADHYDNRYYFAPSPIGYVNTLSDKALPLHYSEAIQVLERIQRHDREDFTLHEVKKIEHEFGFDGPADECGLLSWERTSGNRYYYYRYNGGTRERADAKTLTREEAITIAERLGNSDADRTNFVFEPLSTKKIEHEFGFYQIPNPDGLWILSWENANRWHYRESSQPGSWGMSLEPELATPVAFEIAMEFAEKLQAHSENRTDFTISQYVQEVSPEGEYVVHWDTMNGGHYYFNGTKWGTCNPQETYPQSFEDAVYTVDQLMGDKVVLTGRHDFCISEFNSVYECPSTRVRYIISWKYEDSYFFYMSNGARDHDCREITSEALFELDEALEIIEKQQKYGWRTDFQLTEVDKDFFGGDQVYGDIKTTQGGVNACFQEVLSPVVSNAIDEALTTHVEEYHTREAKDAEAKYLVMWVFCGHSTSYYRANVRFKCTGDRDLATPVSLAQANELVTKLQENEPGRSNFSIICA